MLSDWLPHFQEKVSQTIEEYFNTRYSSEEGIEGRFHEALRYAVEWGGKRLRTILAAISYEYFSKKTGDEILPVLIGIELIHAYTLVHDDLPCMDNDEIRRGKPSVWKAYGETMAVLVGDALQTMGIELLTDLSDIRIIREITHAMNDLGVVGGQVRDTLLQHDTLTLLELLRLHDEKTGGFIAASLVIGTYAASAEEKDIATMRQFGLLLGRAFQIRDDILDVEWDAVTLGKKTGKDAQQHKWIVTLIGLEASKKLLADLEREIYILIADMADERFHDIVEFVVYRSV